MITTLLLDLGNVFIFHDNALLTRNLAEAASRPLADVEAQLDARFHDDINRGKLDGAGMRTYLRERVGVPGSDAEIERLWSSHFTVHTALVSIVERLVGRVKMVLVSNTNDLHVRYCKQQLPILQRLDSLVLSNEVGVAKPDAEIFRIALERAGVAAHQAAFFDDVAKYVDAASALGIAGRLFTTAEAFKRDLAALKVVPS